MLNAAMMVQLVFVSICYLCARLMLLSLCLLEKKLDSIIVVEIRVIPGNCISF